ncbi:MAG: PAS domain S-box-containing protein [Chitinophagales bacterium]|jgi:PAS domain S-box-containing protein
MRQEGMTKLNMCEAFQKSSLPMAVCTKDFLFLDLNKRVEEVLGYSKEELLGKSIIDITAVGDLSFDFKNLEKLLKGEIESYTIKRAYKNKEGDMVHGDISVSLITVEEEQFILGIFYTNKEEFSEMEIISSGYTTLSKILTINPDIHYIMDVENRSYVYQNVDIVNFFGYSAEDLGDKGPIDFLISKIDPNTIKEVALVGEKFRNTKEIGEFVEVEYRFLTKNNGWKWLRAKSTPLAQLDDEKVKLAYGIIQDITERKAIEKKIESQQSFINQVANLIPDVVNVYDINTFTNVYTNLEGKTFLGYTKEDWETKDKVRAASGFTKHIKNSIEKLKALNDDDVFVDEAAYLNKDGENRWLLIKAKVFKRDEAGETEQILAVTTDVSDYKDALDRIDKSKQTISAILEAIPDLVMVIDVDGFYQQVFEGVNFKIAGGESIVGKSIFERLSPKNAKNLFELIKECIRTGDLKPYDFRHELEDGSSAYYSAFISKLNEREVNVLARDVTGSQKLKLALDEKVNQLSDQNEQMEEFIAKNTELERFAYIISHDLKEPLRSISAITELVKIELEDSPNKVLHELLNHLTVNNQRMENLIQGVLDYSKVDSDSLKYNLRLNKVVKAVLSDLKALIEEKNVKVEVHKLFPIRGDETQITQLFQNLISNAIKFNHSDQAKLVIGSEEVNGTYTCYIKDNGIGIPDEFKDSIFKMFKRVNTYDQFPGQGLGLSICKKIVDKHYGKIWVENNDFNGSTFYINFG